MTLTVRRWAYASVVVATLLVAFAIRVFHLDLNFAQGFDEGAYLIAARLIAAGYRPFSQIYMPQLPLFLYNLAWVFQFLGDSVVVGRLLIVAYSMVGMAATPACARFLSNRVGAVAALFILAVNPGFFVYSRAVYLELPPSALAMLALFCVFAFLRRGTRRWLILAGLAWAFAVLFKPFLFGLGLTFVICTVLYRRSLQSNKELGALVRQILLDWLALGIPALVPVLFFLATNDLAAFYYQFIVVNQRIIPDSLFDELRGVIGFLGRDWGMLALALFGTAAGAIRFGAQSTLPLAFGTLATLLLVLQVPGINHHNVVLIPPLAALAGTGFGLAWEAFKRLTHSRNLVSLNAITIFLGAVASLVYMSNVFALSLFDFGILQIPILPRTADCIKIIHEESAPGDFVVSDQPMLVYRAGRLIPPTVAISSGLDIEAGGVTRQTLIDSVKDNRVPFIVISNPYRMLPDWVDWVKTRYQRVATCNDSPREAIELYEKR